MDQRNLKFQANMNLDKYAVGRTTRRKRNSAVLNTQGYEPVSASSPESKNHT